VRAYQGLIKMNRAALDEKRRKLRDLENLAQGFRDDMDSLAAEVDRERQVASENVEISYTFASYLSQAKKRRARMADSLQQTEHQIDLARGEVEAAYQEVRKYEMAEENRLKRARAEADQREAADLNEIGLNLYRFRRQQSQP